MSAERKTSAPLLNVSLWHDKVHHLPHFCLPFLISSLLISTLTSYFLFDTPTDRQMKTTFRNTFLKNFLGYKVPPQNSTRKVYLCKRLSKKDTIKNRPWWNKKYIQTMNKFYFDHSFTIPHIYDTNTLILKNNFTFQKMAFSFKEKCIHSENKHFSYLYP